MPFSCPILFQLCSSSDGGLYEEISVSKVQRNVAKLALHFDYIVKRSLGFGLLLVMP